MVFQGGLERGETWTYLDTLNDVTEKVEETHGNLVKKNINQDAILKATFFFLKLQLDVFFSSRNQIAPTLNSEML